MQVVVLTSPHDGLRLRRRHRQFLVSPASRPGFDKKKIKNKSVACALDGFIMCCCLVISMATATATATSNNNCAFIRRHVRNNLVKERRMDLFQNGPSLTWTELSSRSSLSLSSMMVIRGGGGGDGDDDDVKDTKEDHDACHSTVFLTNHTAIPEDRRKKKQQQQQQQRINSKRDRYDSDTSKSHGNSRTMGDPGKTTRPKQRRRKKSHPTTMPSSSLSSSTSLILPQQQEQQLQQKQQQQQQQERRNVQNGATSLSNVNDEQEISFNGNVHITIAKDTSIVEKKKHDKNSHRSFIQNQGERASRQEGAGTGTAAGGKQGECLRRIKREWKDAVRLGIAYDWKTRQTVTVHGRSASGLFLHGTRIRGDNDDGDDDRFYQYNYVRMGPYGKNLLRWHFSVLGPANSPYSEGIYHGRILLPKNYPMSPPRVQMLTPSGRFVPGEDICLSASNYHPETWTPRWTILSLIDGLRLHMLTSPNEIGGIDASREERMKLAAQSRLWKAGSVDHGVMVNSGIFGDKTTSMARSRYVGEERVQDMPTDASSTISSSSSSSSSSLSKDHRSADYFGVKGQSVERSTVLSPHDAKEFGRKRTLIQEWIVFSVRTCLEVCKSPYFQLMVILFFLFQLFLRPS